MGWLLPAEESTPAGRADEIPTGRSMPIRKLIDADR
jgi:hypothetical protein